MSSGPVLHRRWERILWRIALSFGIGLGHVPDFTLALLSGFI
jgi:hypothetical protein